MLFVDVKALYIITISNIVYCNCIYILGNAERNRRIVLVQHNDGSIASHSSQTK
jgi:hypothetical protein